MQVKWLAKALKNLDAEAEYIAEDNPKAARVFVQTVWDATQNLATTPAVGRPGRVPGTRELVIDGFQYIVPYRVKGDQVQILRVFHTRRKPPKNW